MVGLSKSVASEDDSNATSATASTEVENVESEEEEATKMYQVGILLAIVCVITDAMSLVTTRRLRALSVILIQWYYALCSCLVTGSCVWFMQEKSFKLAFTEST